MGVRRTYRRSDLFLVRLWAEEVGDAADASGNGSGNGNSGSNGNVEWRGKVQRVVDGESHQFSDWQSLAEVLVVMLSKKEQT